MNKNEGIVVHIPLKVAPHHGRKRIIVPNGTPLLEKYVEQDDHLIGALLRAWKWNHMLETGKAASADDLAKKLKISPTYLCRVLRLNFLAPDIRTAILDGKQPKGLRLIDLMKPFPMIWDEQREWLGLSRIAE